MARARRVRCDIDGLHNFARAVDAEVEHNFQPHTVPLLESYSTGVTNQLTAYVNASKILVDAVRQVAKNYTDADALSEAQAKEVQDAFGSAIQSAQAAQAAAQAATQAQAHHGGSARAL